jgi:hypothetical protein
MLLIAELIQSYPQASEFILPLKHSDQRLFLQLLIESVILEIGQSTEIINSANAIFLSTMNANTSDACNELLVQIIQDTLNNTLKVATKDAELGRDEGKEFCQKITTLTKFLSLLRDICLANIIRENSKRTFIHIVHDKNLLLEFVKAIRLLPINQSQVAEAINAILRLFDNFSQSIGVAKAAISNSSASNEEAPQPSLSSPPTNSTQATNDQPTSSSAAQNQPPNPQVEVQNRMEIPDDNGDAQVMLEVFEVDY